MLPLALSLLLSAATPPVEEAPTFTVSVGALAGGQFFDFVPGGTARRASFLTGARLGVIAQLTERLGVMPSLNLRFDAGNLRTEWTVQANLVSTISVFRIFAGVGSGLATLPGTRPTPVVDVRAGAGGQVHAVLITLDAELRLLLPTGGRAMALTLTAAWQIPVRR